MKEQKNEERDRHVSLDDLKTCYTENILEIEDRLGKIETTIEIDSGAQGPGKRL